MPKPLDEPVGVVARDKLADIQRTPERVDDATFLATERDACRRVRQPRTDTKNVRILDDDLVNQRWIDERIAA